MWHLRRRKDPSRGGFQNLSQPVDEPHSFQDLALFNAAVPMQDQNGPDVLQLLNMNWSGKPHSEAACGDMPRRFSVVPRRYGCTPCNLQNLKLYHVSFAAKVEFLLASPCVYCPLGGDRKARGQSFRGPGVVPDPLN
jgi:hypothetical protein